jgi:hypothetical protein
MRHVLLLLVLLGALAGCASREYRPPSDHEVANARDGDSLTTNVGQATSSAMSQTRGGLKDAALSPLEDFNLRREPIPPVLEAIQNPYDLPTDLTCLDLTRLISELDAALGADWDAPAPDPRLRTEQLADSAANAALDAVADEARGLIPFRDVVRRATGADSHEKRYNRAFKMGAQRRAYLKGIGVSRECTGRAAPDFSRMPERKIEFRGSEADGMATPKSSPSIWSRATPWKDGGGETKNSPPK